MKAIILIALFAFAAQASLLDTTSYVLGFNQQLGFDSLETTDGLACFTSLNQTLADVATTIQAAHYDASDLVMSVLNLIATVDGPLKENCQAYVSDMITFIVQNTNVTDSDEVEYIIERNANAYPAQLIQEITAWIDAVASEDAYTAGSTEAYIFQILLGLATPIEIVQPVLTADDYVPINNTDYIGEFYQSFFNSVGVSDSSDAIVQCFNNITVAVPTIQDFVRDFEQADEIVDKVEVLRTAADDLSFVVEACTPAIEADLELYAPVYEAIKEDPVPTIITIIHNLASNLVQLEQDSIDQSTDMFTGKYAEAGETAAAMLLTIFANAGY